MHINQFGSVVPHVNPGVTPNHSITHQRATYVRRGATLEALLVDCWSRGFSAYETINICSVNGYALCIAETARRRVWAHWDSKYLAESAKCVQSLEDIMVWPCGTWCYREELSQMQHMSDDYQTLLFGSVAYNEFLAVEGLI